MMAVQGYRTSRCTLAWGLPIGEILEPMQEPLALVLRSVQNLSLVHRKLERAEDRESEDTWTWCTWDVVR